MNDENAPTSGAGISTRTVEIAVALLLFAFGATVVFDSYRLGAVLGQRRPAVGLLPVLHRPADLPLEPGDAGPGAVRRSGGDRKRSFSGAVARRRGLFVACGPLRQVLSVLLPAVVYVLFVQLIGIYVASAVYIALFMVWLGKYTWLRSAAVGLVVTVCFFLMFEVWFKVPLSKGIVDPLAWLGY